LLAGGAASAAVTAILRYQEHLAGVRDWLEKNVVECVGNMAN
jgi:hypothetical protein